MIVQTAYFEQSNALRFGITENHTYGTHIHFNSEIVLVLEGSTVSTVNGIEEVAHEGDIIFIPPMMTHSTLSTEYSKLFICVLSNDFLTDIVSMDELFNGYDRAVFTPSSELRAYAWKKLIGLYDEIEISKCDNNLRTFKSCFHIILDEFTHIAQPLENKRASMLLSNIFLYIGEHFKEPITQASVSKALGYSSSHISHALRLFPNMNFASLLNSIRLEYAKKLLLERRLSITEIAYECGFSCERTFYRAFSKMVNMTPREYIKAKGNVPSFLIS